MRMLVDKIWFLMSEMNRGPGYHVYHRTCLHLKKTKRVGQMDDFRIQNLNCAIKVSVTKFEGSSYPTFNRFPDFKGVVDWFFSRLDCVYGVQSNMCSCFVFLKTHYFSHNLPLFHTTLSLLGQTPRFISCFYEAPPSMGSDWLAGSVCCDWLNRL